MKKLLSASCLLLLGFGCALPIMDEQGGQYETGERPSNLVLPVAAEDIGSGNEFISPFGVVRFSKDTPEMGHSGIDIPVDFGDPIYAVASGAILSSVDAEDGHGGQNVKLLIADGNRKGEGWVFFYEHVTLIEGVEVGTEVSSGQQIATSALSNGNNHLQYSYFFNDFEYSMEPDCWIDYLSETEQEKVTTRFDQIKEKMGQSWLTATDEDRYPLRGLINNPEYPNGPQMCYPQGTDVRSD